MKNFVAIDPGITGALVFFEDGKPSHIYDMQTVLKGSKKVVDSFLTQMLFAAHEPQAAIIERVGASPRMGVSSAFNFGHSAGVMEGICAGFELPIHFITPQKWKTMFGLMKQDKDAARIKAIEMFPHLKEQLKLKKHVDRADALFIGLAWARINKQ